MKKRLVKRTEFCQPGDLAYYRNRRNSAICLVLSSPAPRPDRHPDALFQWVIWSDTQLYDRTLMYHVPSVLLPLPALGM